jgi:N6-adenosine-specific RNA methylase IME4
VTELERRPIEGAVVDRSPDQLARLIRLDLAGAVEGIVAAGRHLREAREVIEHGRWEDWIRDDVGMSPDKALMLMSIAGHLVISNPEHARDLPASWSTLYELSRLEPSVVKRAISDGEITPETERRDARALVSRHKAIGPVAEPVPPPAGRYRCIVIDPPWPMPKIERDVRPNQYEHLDYPTMTLEQLADEQWLPVRTLADDDCHIYLWVTHKFLPVGMDLLTEWGFNYQCVMTWRKNVGITPFSWMYDTEHVLFGRRGNLKLERLGLRLSFEAAVNGHSVKPDVFYERVREASPGPRIDMFPGVEHEGFEPWGLEASHRDVV